MKKLIIYRRAFLQVFELYFWILYFIVIALPVCFCWCKRTYFSPFKDQSIYE